jgi:hypothetical protein
MAVVQPFTRSMIEQCLRSTQTKYLKDSDGDFIVQFNYSDEIGCDFDILIMAGGKNADICSVTGRANKRIQKNDWGRAIMICNTWNKEKRWPKAYLYVQDPATSTSGAVYLEQQIDLSPGVHQELLNDFIFTTISGVISFWEWAHQEQGL